MNKIKITLLLFVAGLQMASANIIQAGMVDDFENGTTASWTKANRLKQAKILPPENIVDETGNRYLQIKSRGATTQDKNKEDPHSRMVFYNQSQWAGDYSAITNITARMKATSQTEDNLYMRLALFDEKVNDQPQSRYVSKAANILKTDGEWHFLSFSLNPLDLVRFRGNKSVAEVLKNVSQLRFLSSKDQAAAWQVDKVKAVLGVDDITAVAVVPAAVPLPASLWFMLTAMAGLIKAVRRSYIA